VRFLPFLLANLLRRKLRALLTVGSFAVALFLLGLLVAVLDLVPLAGATLAAIIVSTVVFIETDWLRALIVIGFFIGYQQFENHVLQPVVYGKAVRLSPLVVLVAVLIGAAMPSVLTEVSFITNTQEAKQLRSSPYRQRIAEALAGHPQISRLYYPSLFEDPEQVRIRDAQTKYPGSLLSLELRGGKPAAFEFLRRLRIARNAVSLGGVETLSCLPASTSHIQLGPEGRAKAGIPEGLVRVSAGIEDVEDLWADIDQAVARAATLKV